MVLLSIKMCVAVIFVAVLLCGCCNVEPCFVSFFGGLGCCIEVILFLCCGCLHICFILVCCDVIARCCIDVLLMLRICYFVVGLVVLSTV